MKRIIRHWVEEVIEEECTTLTEGHALAEGPLRDWTEVHDWGEGLALHRRGEEILVQDWCETIALHNGQEPTHDWTEGLVAPNWAPDWMRARFPPLGQRPRSKSSK